MCFVDSGTGPTCYDASDGTLCVTPWCTSFELQSVLNIVLQGGISASAAHGATTSANLTLEEFVTQPRE